MQLESPLNELVSVGSTRRWTRFSCRIEGVIPGEKITRHRSVRKWDERSPRGLSNPGGGGWERGTKRRRLMKPDTARKCSPIALFLLISQPLPILLHFSFLFRLVSMISFLNTIVLTLLTKINNYMRASTHNLSYIYIYSTVTRIDHDPREER